jgi:hypothetical protein
VKRRAISSCGGEPTTVCCGSGPTVLATLAIGAAAAIALDAQNVYWIDQGLGAIMMREKSLAP